MKKKFSRLAVGLFLTVFSIVYLNAFWVYNDPTTPFPPKTSIQIGGMIVDGASQLLQSASEAFLFMNEVEVAERGGLNHAAALQHVDLAAALAERALKQFLEILAVGNEVGYDENRTAKLKAFDYMLYAKENGLSDETMARVATYLAQGDVLGLYKFHCRNLSQLLKTLDMIKSDLLADKLPQNQVLWSLLQQYSLTMMYGNYASLVFYQI